MKINHNMSAVTVNNQLKRTENALTVSLERLSSGLRINRAADDAAGMAISNKMQAQIDGLDQASRNASDGSSVLQTVDGALNEVTSMLQRMRELSVQAATDTNTASDLAAIQKEMTSLRDEIDRVSEDTEFNTKQLLDGSLERRVYTNTKSVSGVKVSDSVEAKTYSFSIEADARQAVYAGAAGTGTAGSTIPAGKVVINGSEIEIKEGESASSVYEKLRVGAQTGEANVIATDDRTDTSGTETEYAGYTAATFEFGKPLVFISDDYGSDAALSITCDNTELANFLGLSASTNAIGTDAKVSYSTAGGFGVQATMAVNGNHITFSDRDGFSMELDVDPGIAQTKFTDGTDANGDGIQESTGADSTAKEIRMEVTDIGTMTLQIGANENQTIDISIPDMSAKSLGIDELDVTTITGADKAIGALDDALATVSQVRSKVGAYENRLDYTVGSLDEFSENMTSALSRIADVDMAEEMSEYTKQNVLQQAATSVLSQANDLPQQVLQLLQ